MRSLREDIHRQMGSHLDDLKHDRRREQKVHRTDSYAALRQQSGHAQDLSKRYGFKELVSAGAMSF